MDTKDAVKRDASPLDMIHVFPCFHTLGGVESVLQLHYTHDLRFGVNSEFLIYAETPGPSDPRVHFISISPADSLNEVAHKVASVTQVRKGCALVYHMLWPLPLFAPFDSASRRLLLIHGDYPSLRESLSSNADYVDGIVCVNSTLREKAQSLLPFLDPSRISVVNYPIHPVCTPSPNRSLANPIRIGFCGRLIKEQKRVDLILPFVRLLTDLDIDYTLEILGDGPDRGFLQTHLPHARCRFYGTLRGDAYWHVISQWDVIAYFSDYEGTPISLLEAMSQGVIPLYPRIQTGGDVYVESVHPSLLYPREDLATASQAVKRLTALSEVEVARLRSKCMQKVEPHSIEAYFRGFYEHVRFITNKPSVAQSKRRFRHRALGLLSVKKAGQLGMFKNSLASWLFPGHLDS